MNPKKHIISLNFNFSAFRIDKRSRKGNARAADSGNTYQSVIVGELLNPSCAHQRKRNEKNKKIEEKKKLIINSIEIPNTLEVFFPQLILLHLIGNYLLINSWHEFRKAVDNLLELNQLFDRKRHKRRVTVDDRNIANSKRHDLKAISHKR